MGGFLAGLMFRYFNRSTGMRHFTQLYSVCTTRNRRVTNPEEWDDNDPLMKIYFERSKGHHNADGVVTRTVAMLVMEVSRFNTLKFEAKTFK